MKRQIELEREMQQKKREADERRHSEKRGCNRPGSSKTSEEREQEEESDFRSNSPPIPTMRGKESDMKEQEKETNMKDEATSQEKKVPSNRFENNDGPESSHSNQSKGRSNKSRSSSKTESAAVVAQLQTMRQGLERRKEMLKQDELGSEEWDALV